MELKNKKVAILGMGIEGIAVAEYLQGSVAELFLLDKSSIEELKSGPQGESLDKIISGKKVWYKFGEGYMDYLSQFDVIFRSPGISYYNEKLVEARNRGVKVTSQIKLFFELCPARIIGVTGTKGKGTTSTLIEKILKDFDKSVYIAGNIGYPAITLLPELKSDDFVILELSSFQLMDLNSSPHIAVITNLLVDHLDYHKDINEYLDAKLNIVRFQKKGDYAIVNSDVLDRFGEILNKTGSHVYTFTDNKGIGAYANIQESSGDNLLYLNNELVCKQSELKLLGRHNLENVAAAVITTSILGIPLDKARKSIREFMGLPHRLETIVEKNDILYINDSFATNPLPTIAAINAIERDKVLILGGSSKGADFSELSQIIAKSNVRAVVLIGDEGEKIDNALKKEGYNGKVIIGLKKMSDIVRQAIDLAVPGNAIVLSPACASFGLFSDYKDRGNQFRESVLELTKD